LAFLGLGADTGQPDWGGMVWVYRAFLLESPRLIVWPVAAITILALALHLAFDPAPIGSAQLPPGRTAPTL